MKVSFTLGAAPLLALAACGGETGAEEPEVAEERVGERELGREGVVEGEIGEREGMAGVEGREREGMVGAEGVEREE